MAVNETVTVFGAELDQAARAAAGWPPQAVVHTVEVMNPQLRSAAEHTQIKLTGGVPVGKHRNGSPRFGKRCGDLCAFVTLAQYQAAFAARDAAKTALNVVEG